MIAQFVSVAGPYTPPPPFASVVSELVRLFSSVQSTSCGLHPLAAETPPPWNAALSSIVQLWYVPPPNTPPPSYVEPNLLWLIVQPSNTGDAPHATYAP